jgi:hypothetical protein
MRGWQILHAEWFLRSLNHSPTRTLTRLKEDPVEPWSSLADDSIDCRSNENPSCSTDHVTRGYNTDHPVPESRFLRPIESAEAGCFRFQEADRLSRMADLAGGRVRDHLLGRQIDLLSVELTLGYAKLDCGR